MYAKNPLNLFFFTQAALIGTLSEYFSSAWTVTSEAKIVCTSCDLDNRVIISKQTLKQQSFNNLMSVIQIPSYKCACFTIIYADFKTQLHVIFCCIICNTGKNSISNKCIFIPHVPYQWLKHKLPFKCDLSIFLEIKLNI